MLQNVTGYKHFPVYITFQYDILNIQRKDLVVSIPRYSQVIFCIKNFYRSQPSWNVLKLLNQQTKNIFWKSVGTSSTDRRVNNPQCRLLQSSCSPAPNCYRHTILHHKSHIVNHKLNILFVLWTNGNISLTFYYLWQTIQSTTLSVPWLFMQSPSDNITDKQ